MFSSWFCCCCCCWIAQHSNDSFAFNRIFCFFCSSVGKIRFLFLLLCVFVSYWLHSLDWFWFPLLVKYSKTLFIERTWEIYPWKNGRDTKLSLRVRVYEILDVSNVAPSIYLWPVQCRHCLLGHVKKSPNRVFARQSLRSNFPTVLFFFSNVFFCPPWERAYVFRQKCNDCNVYVCVFFSLL